MKNRVRYKTFEQISFADMMVYSKLPKHPFWSNIESRIDFSFADRLCAVLYSGRGQHPFAPSLKLKVHLIQAYNDLPDRKVEEKIIGDLFIKRFLGLPVDFFGFDHSTIGLDRNRMGTAMFQACHLYILAQMYSLGLWGDNNEQWIIDSFPSNAGVVMTGGYRLIQQGMIRIMQHLKRSHSALYQLTGKSVLLDAMTYRLPAQSSTSDRMLAFSKLAAQAYGLLHWFENDNAAPLFWKWEDKKAQLKSLELQAVLMQILMENSRPCEPDTGANPKPESDDESTPPDDQTAAAVAADTDLAAVVQYEKIPRKERPAHRIISANDPDARLGAKTRFIMIKGYKTQNLCTTSSVILDTRVVPASEHDREAMFGMVKEIQSFFQITPRAVLGDTAYGHGKQRLELASIGIDVVAPVISTKNPTALFDITRFTYNRGKDVYICPNGKETIRKNHNTQIEGWQYFFGKHNCSGCPFRDECTTNKNGRSVFHSDYYEIYETAKAFNESDEGKETLKQRYLVERKNNELKNDCGLGEPRMRSRRALAIKAKLSAIVVNLKLTVRCLLAPNSGFVRRLKNV